MAIARTLALLALAVAPAAFAYRPFDHTDASVAPRREVELELGPVGFLDLGGQLQYAPRLIANYGAAKGSEIVFESSYHLTLGQSAAPRFSVSGVQLSLKHVFRPGLLQQEAGPSVAVEFGVLLPGYHDDEGWGGSCTGIASVGAGPVLLHLNLGAALERNGHLSLEPALIAEGPRQWAVRPVAEALWSHEWDGADVASVLAGAIWPFREDLVFDAALRAGRAEGSRLLEARGGVTWSF